MATDWAPILRAARRSAGLSLDALSARTNYSPSQLGHLETRRRRVRSEHVTAYETALGVSISPELHYVATILAATRRLEDKTSPGLVLPAVRGLVPVAETLSAEIGSEIHQYTGWLELVTGEQESADRSFDRAIELATEADAPDRLAHALSFKAYGLLEAGSTTDAGAYTDSALAVTTAHPLIRVYVQYQGARIKAVEGDRTGAIAQLREAGMATERITDVEPPDAAYWSDEATFALQRGRVLWLLGDESAARREVLAGLDAMSPCNRAASWAAKWRAVADGADVPA
ncbi:helix-turn-helix domain-containing protein [Nocardia sp. NPDC052566]|uniref:helix-turn-helix domain-containing protein n=1 Tax=Nocardia sp. NPDC052566 TaxID=3364330 RepID=UPI0037C7D241